MLDGFIALSLPIRLLLVLAAALLSARFINWAIYSFAFRSRALGPWSPPPKGYQTHTFADHLPVLGWWRLKRESKQHGTTYWIRPLLIELIFPIAMAWYYNYVTNGGTLPIPLKPMTNVLQPELHGMLVGHFILFVLMMVATFIDFDEQSIPDYITVPGTIFGLIGAAMVPGWMNITTLAAPVGLLPTEMHACAPNGWESWMNGQYGLLAGVAIALAWGFAELDRRLIFRRGLGKAVQYFVAGIFRSGWWKIVLIVTGVMVLGIAYAWKLPIVRWQYLLSSLMGLAFAGGLTWAVRVVATYALKKQALGFGDVTLMAMIGTYVGWQPSLLIFFVAPVMAVLIVLTQYLITGENAAPYGPYLCAGTVATLVGWNYLWHGWAGPMFVLGLQIVYIMVACVFLMGAMLWIWAWLRQILIQPQRSTSAR